MLVPRNAFYIHFHGFLKQCPGRLLYSVHEVRKLTFDHKLTRSLGRSHATTNDVMYKACVGICNLIFNIQSVGYDIFLTKNWDSTTENKTCDFFQNPDFHGGI